MLEDTISAFLVNIVTGPEHPTRAALEFLVAKTALDEGHGVKVFLAGDAVQLMRPATIDNVEGLDPETLKSQPIEMAMPDEFVRLASEADTVLTY